MKTDRKWGEWTRYLRSEGRPLHVRDQDGDRDCMWLLIGLPAISTSFRTRKQPDAGGLKRWQAFRRRSSPSTTRIV